MVDMVNPTVIGTGTSNGTDPILAALLASGGFGGGGGWGGNRNGNWGGNNVGDFVTNAGLQAALNGQTEGQNTNAILQNLATIQQLIPENEGKVQLALAQAQIALQNTATQGQLQAAAATSLLTNNIADARHNINDNVHTNGLNNANAFAGVQIGIANSTAATNSIVRQVKDVAEAGFAAAQLTMAGLSLQAAQNTAAINANITADGAMTRALINNNTITALRDELAENRTAATVAGGNITITNTMLQQQQQQQQQQMTNAFTQLCGIVGNLQTAIAGQSNLIIGSTGTTTGAQTANPVNVNR
jgi:hypothetical protein